MSDRVAFSLDERGVARVRLVWAAGRNAIDPAMVDQLADAVRRCQDTRVRAVLMSADGSAFTVGGDLRHFAAHTDDLRGAMAAMVPVYHETLTALAALQTPVVAAVHGAVAGGGLGLVWCSDVVLAADCTRFATGFSQLGLSGDGGSAWWLPRLVGLVRARQLLIAGRVLDAEEALSWGLISEVVATDTLQARAEELVGELAGGPTFAFGQMRRLMLGSGSLTLAEHLELESQAMIACAARADAVEGVSAFCERRRPNFNNEPGADNE